MNHIVTWAELPVKDMERAMNFYREILGFDFKRDDMGGYDYAMFEASEEQVSGALFAWCKLRNSFRVFRIDRITRIKIDGKNIRLSMESNLMITLLFREKLTNKTTKKLKIHRHKKGPEGPF